MRIDKLELKNFRIFPSLAADLHPELTVAIGPNASGKTALLEALTVGRGGFLRGIAGGAR